MEPTIDIQVLSLGERSGMATYSWSLLEDKQVIFNAVRLNETWWLEMSVDKKECKDLSLSSPMLRRWEDEEETQQGFQEVEFTKWIKDRAKKEECLRSQVMIVVYQQGTVDFSS